MVWKILKLTFQKVQDSHLLLSIRDMMEASDLSSFRNNGD